MSLPASTNCCAVNGMALLGGLFISLTVEVIVLLVCEVLMLCLVREKLERKSKNFLKVVQVMTYCAHT